MHSVYNFRLSLFSLSTHLGCFYFLAVMKNTIGVFLGKTFVNVSSVLTGIPLEYKCSVELTLYTWRSCCFPVWLYPFYFVSAVYESFNVSTALTMLLIILLCDPHLSGVQQGFPTHFPPSQTANSDLVLRRWSQMREN